MSPRFLPFALATVSVFALTGCGSKDVQSARDEVATMGELSPQIELPRGNSIGLKLFAQTIAVADETVRAQSLDVEIARQENLSAAAMFEPEFYAELNRLHEFKQVNAQEYRAAGGTAASTGDPDPFVSDSDTGKVGIKFGTKVGATVDLFYEME